MPNAVGPLEGIRVLDLTRVLAGPLCTRQLADLGADVVHIAAPGVTGVMGGASAANVARNKSSVVLDLRRSSGREVFLRLCAEADVVVENFRPDVKERLRIGPEDVWTANRGIVYASISGFGQHGPYRDRPGVDMIAQAASGLMSITGGPGTGPWPTGTALSDIAAGTFLAQGVLAALLARARTGIGQHVHTSVYEAAVSVMDPYFSRYLMENEIARQTGGNPTAQPMGAFETADGWIAVAAMFAWERFTEAFGGSGIAADERFATPASRSRNWPELRELMAERFAQESTGHWVDVLVAAGIPAAPVMDVAEAVRDPQFQALDLITEIPWGDRTYAGVRHPVSFSATPTAIRTAPRKPGADTVDVLQAAGVTPTEIERLRAERVLG